MLPVILRSTPKRGALLVTINDTECNTPIQFVFVFNYNENQAKKHTAVTTML
jgi:hypothetical protein